MPAPTSNPVLLEKLDRCLIRFGGIRTHQVTHAPPPPHLPLVSGRTVGESGEVFRCPLTGQVTQLVAFSSSGVGGGISSSSTGNGKSIFFRDHYHFYPNPQDAATALLGEGGYGKAYKVRSATNFNGSETKVCKVIQKVRCTQHESQIRHLCAEIAILTKIAPENPRLNQARAVFFDTDHVYIVLDMTTANTSPDVSTRLYTLFVRDAPDNIPRVEGTVQRWHDDWEVNRAPKIREQYIASMQTAAAAAADVGTKSVSGELGDARLEDGDLVPVMMTPSMHVIQEMLNTKKIEFLDNQVKAVIKNCRLRPEPSYQMDLYDYVYKSHYGRKCLPEAEAAVIMKQCLQGIEFMHRSGVVHRDIKTENVIIGVSRVATPVYEEEEEEEEEEEDGRKSEGEREGGCNNKKKKKMTGLVFHDTIDAQLIDFGLVKHMGYKAGPQGRDAPPTPSKFGLVPSPKIGMPVSQLGLGSRSSTLSWMIDSNNVSSDKISGGNRGGSTPRKESSGMSAVDWGGGGGGAGHATTTGFGQEVKLVPGAYIECTPCGTDVYVAMEGLLGMKGKGKDDHWMSTVEDLPKLDIFGLGAMHYFMVHGHAPFRVNKTMPPFPPHCKSSKDQRDWKLKHLIELVEKGPNFKSSIFSGTVDLLSRMLENEPANRPTATDLLQEPYFARVTDRYCYTVNLQGKELPRMDSGVFEDLQLEITPPAGMLPSPAPAPVQTELLPTVRSGSGSGSGVNSSHKQRNTSGLPPQSPTPHAGVQVLNLKVVPEGGRSSLAPNPLRAPSNRVHTNTPSMLSGNIPGNLTIGPSEATGGGKAGGDPPNPGSPGLGERRKSRHQTLDQLRQEIGGYAPPGTPGAAFTTEDDEEDEEEAEYSASGADANHVVRRGYHTDLMDALRAVEDAHLPGSVPDEDDPLFNTLADQ